jgi:hypothetical protein
LGSPLGLPVVGLSLKTLALWQDLARLLLMENTKEQIAQFKLPVLINGTTLEITMNVPLEQLTKALAQAKPTHSSRIKGNGIISDEAAPTCKVHNIPMKQSKFGGWYCSHKNPLSGKFCTEKT